LLVRFCRAQQAGDEVLGSSHDLFVHLAIVVHFQMGRDICIWAGPVVALKGPFLGFVQSVMAAEEIAVVFLLGFLSFPMLALVMRL
jgi:hypothetical protein